MLHFLAEHILKFKLGKWEKHLANKTEPAGTHNFLKPGKWRLWMRRLPHWRLRSTDM